MRWRDGGLRDRRVRSRQSQAPIRSIIQPWSSTGDEIYLKGQAKTGKVHPEEITTLYLKKRRSRLKPVLIGAGTGAGATQVAPHNFCNWMAASG